MPYRSGPICLDETVTVLAQWNDEERWNGFLCPRLDAHAVETTLSAINEAYGPEAEFYGYDWTWQEDGTLLCIERQAVAEATAEWPYSGEIYAPDADGLYALGSYAWVWTEDYDEEI